MKRIPQDEFKQKILRRILFNKYNGRIANACEYIL